MSVLTFIGAIEFAIVFMLKDKNNMAAALMAYVADGPNDQ